jgi:mono/diheme cytochrome c family protein
MKCRIEEYYVDAKSRSWTSSVRDAVPAIILLLPLACQQEMGQQPYDRPLVPSAFFADGRSARPLEAGTVARGHLRDDQALYEGTEGQERATSLVASLVGLGTSGPLTVVLAAPLQFERIAIAGYAATFPFPVSADVLERGRQRFTIFCAVCHDSTGNGNGKIVQRGYTRPPSYITDFSRGFERRGIKVLLRDLPVGYYFEVISKGYGAMPDYAAQVPPRDRWAIISYIRALQFSQRASIAELPEEERQAARRALEATP